MRYSIGVALAAVSILNSSALYAGVRLVPPNVTVGRNLQVVANLELAEQAGELITVKLTSRDPSRMLLSTTPEAPGVESITVTIHPRSRFSSDFFVCGLAESGVVSYTAAAAGVESAAGTVTLAPSGIVFTRAGVPLSAIRTTTGTKAELSLYSALLDASRNFVGPQFVAGGRSVEVDIISSDIKVGSAIARKVTIHGGTANAAIEFQPAGPGSATLTLNPRQGFRTAAQFSTLTATVITPGIAVTDGVTVGQNLQVEATVSLGEPAPPGGVEVMLASDQPNRLLLSHSPAEVGSGSIRIRMPAGSTRATYYLQSIGNSGLVAVTAKAPGYTARTGTITLAPSGVVIGGPPGPPDEAELFRKDAADAPRGFLARLSGGGPVPLLVYTVQLDPVTRRSADLTVQPLRAGVSITASLHTSNPAIGRLGAASLTIEPGSHTASTEFTPLSAGSTVVSVATPEGFETSANATGLTVIVAK